MQRASIDLITISRQFGAGGSDLAEQLARRLNWPVLDRDLVCRVAERLALDEETVKTMDEHPPRFLARVAASLHMIPPDAPIMMETDRVLDLDAVAHAVHQVILDAARTPPLIIVGHGGQSMFRTRPGTFHIRVVAPLEERVQRVCHRLGCDPRTATAQVQRMDADRHEYVRRYFHTEWRDEMLYDIQINTGRISIEAAADAIVALITRNGAEQPSP